MNVTTARSEYLSSAQKAKSLATTIARGETLFADGYSIEPYANRPGVYSVARPDADTRPLQKGESLWNDVDINAQTCTCKAFELHGTCKHLIGANKAIAHAARLIAPLMPVSLLLSQDTVKQKGFGSPEAFKKQANADFG